MYTKKVNTSKKHLVKRLVLMFMAFFIFVSVVSTSLAPLANAQAADEAAPAELSELDKQIKTTLYRNALAICFLHSPLSGGGGFDQNKRIDAGEAAKLNWFGGNGLNNLDIIAGAYLKTRFGSGTISKTGIVPCASGSFMKEAFTALGFKDKVSGLDNVYGFMCEIGFRRSDKPAASTSTSDCKKGTGDWRRGEIGNDSDSDATKLALRDKMLSVTESGVLSLSDAAKYVLFRETALNLCKADGGQEIESNVDDATGAKIKVLDDTNQEVEMFYTWGSGRTSWSTTIGVGEGYTVGFVSRNSGDAGALPLITNRNGYAIFPSGAVNIDGGTRGNSVGIGKPYYFEAWGAGSTNPCTKMAAQANDYFDAFKLYIAANPAEGDLFDPGSGSTAVEGLVNAGTSCGIDGLGWVVCPALSFLGDLLGNIFNGLADNFLSTNVSVVATDSGTYSGWAIFRNFANIAFVIAFLIIIFSQITSIGISNYGLKKMLPRLVIAAILVNASFFVCQLAVDLSNVLGYSLKTVFDNIAISGGYLPIDAPDASGNGFGIAALVVAVIAAGAAAYASLAVLIPVLLGAIVAVLMIILMLIARKALIVILVVVAPLAFVAFLLPNTEKLFDAWRKMFVTLLLLFPIVSIVFGASALASQIIKSVAPSDQLTQIIAVGVAAVPLFFVPGLLKRSLDGVGGVGKALNGFAAKAGGGLGKSYSGSKFAEHRGKLKAEANAYTRAGAYTGKNPFRRMRSAANSKINSNTAFNAVTGGYGGRKAGESAKFENEKVQSAVADLDASGVDPMAHYNTTMDPVNKRSEVDKRAAKSYLLKTMGQAGRDHIYGKSDTTAATDRAASTTGAGGGGTPAPTGSAPGGGAGQYRTNSAGKSIRPSGTSGNDGAFISANEKGAIDSRQVALEASQAAEQDALGRGHSAEDAQAIGAAEYRLHDK